MASKLLRRPAVEEKTGLSTTDIYQGMNAGTFPRSVPLGKRTVGWVEEEVDEWIRDRIAARQVEPPKRKGGPGRGRKGPINSVAPQAA
jgi:prophage regulatory protein